MQSSFFPEEPKPSWDPNQLEFKFFWPLTEQIELGLDYTGCESPRYYYSDSSIPLLYGTAIGTTFTTPVTWSNTLSIDADTITFGNMKMTWYRKILFKLMGFKWKK